MQKMRERLAAFIAPDPPEPPDPVEDLGRGLKPGSEHYRAFVGPPEDYDLLAGIQAGLLFACGLREDHRVADVGCGSLRAGRLLIPYLRRGHYTGLDPNAWLIDKAIEHEIGHDLIRLKAPAFVHNEDFDLAEGHGPFDFILAQSVFSHTYPDMTTNGLRSLATQLAPGGKIVATFATGKENTEGSGWAYPVCVQYKPEHLFELAERAGLCVFPLDWPHPRQRWFVAAAPEDRASAESLAASVRSPATETSVRSARRRSAG
ncbi:MAG: class I SAM-dependent methyltransferase [Planctomycetota bacterium]